MKLTPMLAILLLITVFISCSKNQDLTPQKSISSQPVQSDSRTNRTHWYAQINQLNPSATRFISDDHLIYDGYLHATVKNPQGDYFTYVNLSAPYGSAFSLDSLTMDVAVKNPVDSPFSRPSYDVDFYMDGGGGYAYANFSNAIAATDMGVQGISAFYRFGQSASLVHVFDHYEHVLLQTKNHVLSVYLNGRLKAQIDYTGTVLDVLQDISISFKGSGYINSVDMYNSVTGAPVMTEKFSIDGNSSDTWYL